MAEKYKELNEVLSDIEHLPFRLAEQKKLEGMSITRWHWDTPDFMLSWKEDDLNKNIHVLILEDENGERIKIECNAWKDEDREKRKVRKYNNEEVETVVMGPWNEIEVVDKVNHSLRRAYEKVAGWKEKDLCIECEIPSRIV